MNIRKRTWTWKGRKHSAWRLDWREGGKRHQKQFTTRQEAELFAEKLIRERHSREYGTLVDRITLAQFLPIYERKKPWKTETYCERVMISLEKSFAGFHNRFLTDITPDMIEEFRDQRLSEKIAPSTVRQDLAALADCLAWAVKLRYLHKNPSESVERPSLPTKQDNPATYLPPEHFEKLLTVAGKDKPLYEFAVWTGLRETELLEVEWPDIRDGYVIVRKGKGRKQRIVPLVPQALGALRSVPKRLGGQRIFWWISSRYDAYKRFKRRCRWAGLPAYRFHDLRHTFASWAAMAGVDTRVIAEALGHSQTTVTRRYAHLSPEYQRLELQKLGRTWTKGTRRGQENRKSLKK